MTRTRSVDRRKFSRTTSAQKSAAGKKGRGQDIDSGVKRDLELEKRIDMVVEMALQEQKAVGNDDVVRGSHVVRLNGLRASKLG